MPRYFSGGFVPEKPDPEHWVFTERKPLLPDLYASEHVPTDTGLLDARGGRIMRAANPMGFGRDSDW